MSRIVILCGFCASGKDSVANYLSDKGYSKIISHTTRPMRDGEQNGIDYHFVSSEEFKALEGNGNFIEVRSYDTLVNNVPDKWYYGVVEDSIDKNNINVVVLDIIGLRAFKKEFGDLCTTFFLDVPEEVRRQRCIDRGDYDEYEFNRRLIDDQKRFPDIVVYSEIDHVLSFTDSIENIGNFVAAMVS